MGNEVMPKAPGGGDIKYYSGRKGQPFPKAKEVWGQIFSKGSVLQSQAAYKGLSVYGKILQRSCRCKLAHPSTRSSRLLLALTYCHMAASPLPDWLARWPKSSRPGSRATAPTRIPPAPHLRPRTLGGAPPFWDTSPQRLCGCLPAAWAATPFYKRHGEQIRGYKHLWWREENSFGICKGTSSVAMSAR